jgi:serine/threonine-protein kinase
MANPPARAVVDVGSVIADTYTIEALLGRGGMGAVFLASHKRLAGKQVAIKVLHIEIADTDVVARFKREAEIAAKLNHPNIVGVIDYNVAPDGTPYLVLDYLQGETLAQCIARGPVPIDQVMSIVRQVGSALAAAHRAGIVHRDLKPQNIFLVPTEIDGRIVEIAKVLDFGISKIRGSQTVKTTDSMLLGTPQYMAPEQATGQHSSIDERTDVFALGAIVYEMLCGQPAFSGASIPEVVFKVVYEQPAPLAEQVPALPPQITQAVTRAMAKPLDERFATVASFVEALTGQPLTLIRGQPPTAPWSDPPSAARGVATGEAFAHTMGSGDFAGAAVSSPSRAAGTAGTAIAAGTAGTAIAAGTAGTAIVPGMPGPSGPRGPTGTAIGGAVASPVDLAPPARSTVDLRRAADPAHGGDRSGAPRRRVGALAAIVVVVGAVAAAAVVFAIRSPSGHEVAQNPIGARAADPRAADPRAADPRAADPRAADPRAADPRAADPRAADPRAADPRTADPRAADPRAADPRTADPRTADPRAADPRAADPRAADPRAAAPRTADPRAADPRAADPRAADPRAANPKAADPKAADPRAADRTRAEPKAADPRAADPRAADRTRAEPRSAKTDTDDPGAADPASPEPPKPPGPTGHRPADPRTGHRSKPPVIAPPPREPDDEPEDETGSQKKLLQAEDALMRQEYDLAERLANAVSNSPGPLRRRAAAWLIHGQARCVANDYEGMRIDLRKLENFRNLRARLVGFCRDHGVQTGP